MQEPHLRLRGGGSSSTRREARKRKFAHSDFEGLCTQDSKIPTLAQGTNDSDVKRSKITVTSSLQESPLKQDEGVSISDGQSIGIEKSQRFICFVGNLPFTATTDVVTQHFASLRPRSIRHRTVLETGKSKGFAFLEFDGYDRMKTCLQLFHHSTFDDGLSPPRKINVELTAGGGGAKSRGRRSKLLIKNEKLNEERKRRAQTKEQQELKSTQAVQASPEHDSDIVHPSRRGRMTGI